MGAVCRGILRQPVQIDIRRGQTSRPIGGSAGDEEAGVEESSVMGDIVDLQGKPVPTRDDIEFISGYGSLQRELILTEKAIRKKYRLADDVWNALGNDDNLVRADRGRIGSPGQRRQLQAGEIPAAGVESAGCGGVHYVE